MAQQPSRTVSAVDAELASLCGEASSPYAGRGRLIHRLPSNLAPEQLERCRAFLKSPLAKQELPDLEFNGLKSELVFALLRQREGPTEFAELLVRMSRAPETDATLFLTSPTGVWFEGMFILAQRRKLLIDT